MAIVHTYPVTRAGVCTLLHETGVEVVLEVEDSDALEDRLASVPNIQAVLVQVVLPIQRTVEIIERVREQCSAAAVIAIGDLTEPIACQLLGAGAKGLLAPAVQRAELHQAIRTGAAGGLHDNEWTRKGLAANGTQGDKAEQGQFQLSPSQEKVLRGIVQGLTNKKIAEKTHIPVRTVDSIRCKLLDLFGARNRADLVRKAIAMRMI